MSQTNYLFNQSLQRTHVCAQCWGELVEKCNGLAFVVICPRKCQPGGYVTREYAERRAAESLSELAEVAANYPELDDRPHQSEQQRATMIRALFGEE